MDFAAEEGTVRALDSFGYELGCGEAVAVLGESGCGKTVHALAAMGLLPQPPAKIISGEILLNGEDTLSMDAERLRRLRGAKISMIFQDPMTSLNPVMPVGEQIAEALTAHEKASAKEALKKAVSLMRKTGIPRASERASDYPHQFSGGMRQRAMIAMALACGPDVLIADEPTTALDVTVQAQILNLIDSLRRETGMAVVFITHNMAAALRVAEKAVVVYAGRRVETGAMNGIFKTPLHPYTRGLAECVTSLSENRKRLAAIPGQPPAPGPKAEGCGFTPRCAFKLPKCEKETPPEFSAGENRLVRCWLYEN